MTNHTMVELGLPDSVLRAHAFTLCICNEPRCGVHILSVDADDVPICDTVIGLDFVEHVIEQFREIVEYKKGNPS